jgi:hypothetical protein
MLDIELVIKIPKDSYEATCNGCMLPPDVENVVNAIKNGTPLPKGHGRLIDIDKLKQELINEEWITDNDGGGLENIVDEAPTIIEADKESDSE